MKSENVQIISQAIMAATLVTQIHVIDPEAVERSVRFLAGVRKKIKESLLPDAYPEAAVKDQAEAEKWLDSWNSRIAQLVMESGLEHDEALLALARSVASDWEGLVTDYYRPSSFFGSSSMLPGDSTTDAPPPK